MGEVVWKPVIWYVKAVRVIRGNRKRGKKLHLGYCIVGKGTAFISTDMLHPLIIGSVDIHTENGNTYCGDARWCFNLKCPLNKAEPSKFVSYGIRTREELEKMHRLLEEIIENLKAIYGEQMFEKNGGMVVFKEGAPLTLYLKE